MDNYKLLEACQFRPNHLEFPDSWVGHIPFANWLIKTIKPAMIVELGTHSGNSYLTFCQAVKEASLPTRCYAVDTWKGDEHAGFYGEEVFQALSIYHNEHYASFSRLMRMTFDEAVHYFSDGSIELLHIDGMHTYEAVKHDFMTWLPKLAPHAVVLFHDTNVREREFGVWRIWQELCQNYPLNIEFLHSHGLGIIQITAGSGRFKLDWLQEDHEYRENLVRYFSSFGLRVKDQYQVQVEIHNLQVLLNETKQQSIAYQAELSDSKQQSTAYQAELSDSKQQSAAYQFQLEEKDNQINKLLRDNKDRDQQYYELQNELREKDKEIKRLDEKLSIAENEIIWYELSNSWKITRPLRKFKNFFSRKSDDKAS
ncbi:MAG: class I SAM-dependent methyltransferase [Anaerolineaceae bacterium]|nr:class I SAM-dependent methyltransferase [Anaerolineaceae bacterium]